MQTHTYVDQAKNERWISEPLYTSVKVSLKNFFPAFFSSNQILDIHWGLYSTYL